MEQQKLCISVDDMAKSLGISLSAAYRLANGKDFYPAKRVCGRILVSLTELAQWLKEQNAPKEGDEI